MKSYIKNLAVLTAALLAAGCSVDYVEPDQKGLPEVSQLTPVITVDQETNYVTFSVQETGVVPLWIFGEEKIDGKANKNYAYAQNGVSLRFRDAGTHTVTLRAYNANGISTGSKTCEFTLENTYRDPFDASPYLKAIANTWVWNSSVDGHFGCGESGTEGTNWWSCGANEKADWSLYDDQMTFDADGNYTYDPVDGYVYVNKDSEFKAEYKTEDADYLAPIDKYTHKYSVENNWNDQGIEEIWLVLAEGDNLSYIPNPDALTSPRYRFLETSVSKMKKEMQLVIDNGSIAWKYDFIPYVKQAGPEEFLAGTDASGKAWVMDYMTKGHLACGESKDNPANWWAAGPNEKDGCGMYDDVLTFYPDGKYVFSPGEDGMIYFNKDVTVIGSEVNPHDGNDVMMAYEEVTSTYTFDGEVLQFPEGVIIGYVPNDLAYTEAKYYVTAISETQMTIVQVAEGISWQYIFKARDIKEPESTFGGVAFESGVINEISLTQGQSIAVTGIDLNTMWIDPDFFEEDGGSLKFQAVDGDYKIVNDGNWLKVIPLYAGAAATYDNGKTVWMIGDGFGKPQGSTPGWSTGDASDLPMATISPNHYQITLYYTGSGSTKIFGQADWGTEWGYSNYGTVETGGLFYVGDGAGNGDNGNIYASGAEAGWYTFSVVDNDGTFDLTIAPYSKKSQYFDIEGSTNLWRNTNITMGYWYANSGWGQIDNPDFEWTDETKKNCTLVIPEGIGGSEWQGQTQFQTEIPASADKLYDFCFNIEADQSFTYTVKLAWLGNDNDHAFFYDNTATAEEYTVSTYKQIKISPDVDYDKVVLFLDFGRTPAGTTISLTDFCLQEHLEK